MTRALVTQLVEALEGLANTHQQGRSVAAEGAFGYVEMHVQNAEGAITAAREYLANEPKSERAELIANLRSQECCQAHGGAGSHHTRCKECPRNVGDMLEADADLRTQLARRRVERDMAISMIGDCIDAQQATTPVSTCGLDTDTLRDMAGAAFEEAMAFGISTDSFERLARHVNKAATEAAQGEKP